MSYTPRIVLLTGNALRHRYVAQQLAERAHLVGVLIEAKAPIIAQPELLPAGEQEIVERHLDQRGVAEREIFGASIALPDVPTYTAAHGQSNTAEVADWVDTQRPDYLALFGTSIIKDPLLTRYADRVVNLHLGLSPYYRGTATNFWPLVERQPECVGATLHIATLKVDAGPILAQVRPMVEAGDRSHELGCKTIVAAAEALPRVLTALETCKAWQPPTQSGSGKLFRRRDFNAQAVLTMWRQFETGMMAEYVSKKSQRDAQFPIVELDQLPQG